MEITQENFEFAFPLVQESIEQSDFISFDTEFSGILYRHIIIYLGHRVAEDERGHEYETIDERY
jgi:uncharacterized protein YprB with RNaseH-like and TPR domain